MKKYIALFLSVILTFSFILTLSGCSKGNNIEIKEPNNETQNTTQNDLPAGIGLEVIDRDNFIALRYLMPTMNYIDEIDEKCGNKVLKQVEDELKRNFDSYANIETFEETHIITKEIQYEGKDYYLISGKLNNNFFRILYCDAKSTSGYLIVNCYIQTDGGYDILDTIVK